MTRNGIGRCAEFSPLVLERIVSVELGNLIGEDAIDCRMGESHIDAFRHGRRSSYWNFRIGCNCDPRGADLRDILRPFDQRIRASSWTDMKATREAVSAIGGHILIGDWQALAQCILAEPDEFFPDQGVRADYAKGFCQSCRVREACLMYAILKGETDGIWGGKTPRERQALTRSIRAGRDAEDVAVGESISVESAHRLVVATRPILDADGEAA